MAARLILLACLAGLACMVVAAPATDKPTTPAPTTVDPACVKCPQGKDAMVPNLCSCQRYFECSKKGQVTPKICLPWENFDSDELVCKFWSKAKCGDSTLEPTDPTPTGPTEEPTEPTEEPTEPTEEPTEPTEEPKPTVVPGCDWSPQCPAVGNVDLGVPCPDSCKLYVSCKDGQWTKKECGWLMNFDNVKKKCVVFKPQCA